MKSDTVGIIPTAGYRMRDRQYIEGLQWLAYIVRTKNIIQAGNGRDVHLDGVLNVNVDGYCQDTNEVWVFELFRYGWLHTQST